MDNFHEYIHLIPDPGYVPGRFYWVQIHGRWFPACYDESDGQQFYVAGPFKEPFVKSELDRILATPIFIPDIK